MERDFKQIWKSETKSCTGNSSVSCTCAIFSSFRAMQLNHFPPLSLSANGIYGSLIFNWSIVACDWFMVVVSVKQWYSNVHNYVFMSLEHFFGVCHAVWNIFWLLFILLFCFSPPHINWFAILQGAGGRPGFGRGSGGFGAPTSSNLP